MPREKLPIKTITLKNGKKRYRFVVDVGTKPNSNKRDQRTFTYDSYTEAKNEYLKKKGDIAKGTYVGTSKMTLAAYIEQWLGGKRKIAKSTLGNYRDALKPVTERLGHIQLQKLTKKHVDDLVDWMRVEGRRVNKPGTKLADGTVSHMLKILTMCLRSAEKEGLVVRNVAALVDRPNDDDPREPKTWTAEQAQQFLDLVADDRLFIAWCLSLYGLRRGEVLGLRWEDVNLEKKTITLQKTRIIVDGKVIHSRPKSHKSRRTLPLFEDLVEAFKRTKKRQAAEKLEAGPAYDRSACADCGGHHVVVNELGELIHPETYSDKFEWLVKKAKLPMIRLHDARHTCGSLMHKRGVPAIVIAAWLGHANPNFTMRTYIHEDGQDLEKARDELAAVYQLFRAA